MKYLKKNLLEDNMGGFTGGGGSSDASGNSGIKSDGSYYKKRCSKI